MKKLFITLLFVFSHSAISSEVIETWECQENSYGKWKNILVKAKINGVSVIDFRTQAIGGQLPLNNGVIQFKI